MYLNQGSPSTRYSGMRHFCCLYDGNSFYNLPGNTKSRSLPHQPSTNNAAPLDTWFKHLNRLDSPGLGLTGAEFHKHWDRATAFFCPNL